MKARQTAAKTIDDYIAAFPGDTQEKLQKLRATIKKVGLISKIVKFRVKKNLEIAAAKDKRRNTELCPESVSSGTDISTISQ